MTFTAAVLAAFIVTIGSAEAAPAKTPPANDLTPQFRAAGIDMDRFEVTEIGGIVVIRGRAANAQQVEDATRIARTLGHARVANLIHVSTPPDDAAIQRKAERELTTHRALDGCRFNVRTAQGVVSVAGSVHHELQKDVAIELLRNIDGVRQVQAQLNRN